MTKNQNNLSPKLFLAADPFGIYNISVDFVDPKPKYINNIYSANYDTTLSSCKVRRESLQPKLRNTKLERQGLCILHNKS